MEKKNILVFPCGSEIGLDIYNCVRYSTYFKLIGASSTKDHGSLIYEDYIDGIPHITDPLIIPTLQRIIRERKIDAIYPTMDSVICELKRNESILGCKVVSSPYDVTALCLSKRRTYERLNGIVDVPSLYDKDNIPQYPVFVKPDVGYGAIGAKIINDSVELESAIKDRNDMLILENLPGEEYTVDCFTSREGHLIYASARQRNRVKSGISVNTVFVENQTEFLAFAEKINSEISFRGAWFFQVKRRANGELCLMEIASRFGGSSLLSKSIGVNLPQLSLFDVFDYDVDIIRNDYSVELDRSMGSRYNLQIYYDTVYVDYDDCLLLEKSRVNEDLVSFLYKCINRRIKVILLTKHMGNLDESLKQFRLKHIFDEVIHLRQDDSKWKYICSKDSIFIDDSYSERKSVKRRLNIPVFSPEMIDVLM